MLTTPKLIAIRMTKVRQFNLDHIQRMRLRVDTRKWMVGKMNPKKYGDRQVVDGKIEHSGTINDDRMANAMDILARLGKNTTNQKG